MFSRKATEEPCPREFSSVCIFIHDSEHIYKSTLRHCVDITSPHAI